MRQSGAGSTPHLVGELFARSANLQLNHIPYTSGGQATLDLRAGRIDFYAGHPFYEVIPQLKDGGNPRAHSSFTRTPGGATWRPLRSRGWLSAA